MSETFPSPTTPRHWPGPGPYDPPLEQRSSIKVTLNAKHEPQFEVKIVEGTTTAQADAIRAVAIEEYRALRRELGISPE